MLPIHKNRQGVSDDIQIRCAYTFDKIGPTLIYMIHKTWKKFSMKGFPLRLENLEFNESGHGKDWLKVMEFCD